MKAPKKPETSIDFQDGKVHIKASGGGVISGVRVDGNTYNIRDGKVEVVPDAKRSSWAPLVVLAGTLMLLGLLTMLLLHLEELIAK